MYLKQSIDNDDCNFIEFGGDSVDIDEVPWENNFKNPLGPSTLAPFDVIPITTYNSNENANSISKTIM